MIHVLKIGEGVSQIRGNPTLDKLDGSGRARFKSVTSDGWPEGFAALFGVFEVVTVPPEGKQWLGEFDGSVTPPVAVFEDLPFPYQTAAEAKSDVVRWIDSLTNQIIGQYPVAVRERWAIEESAARAVKAGDPSDNQLGLITREGATKNRTPLDHADRVILHADNFRAIADEVNTLFLSVDGQLDAATQPAQFAAIIDGAKAAAVPLAAAYGLTL